MSGVQEALEDSALASVAFAYVDFGVRHGLSREALMSAARLSDALRADPDARCSTVAYMVLWRELLVGLPQVVVPVELALSIDAAALGVVAQIVPRADSVMHAGELVSRFMRLSDTAVSMRLVERGELVGIAIDHRPEVVAMRFPIELMIGIGHRLLALGAGKPVAREITFAHAAGYPLEAYERLFGVPVRFGAEVSAMWLSKASLAEPFPARDPIARRYFEAFADRELAKVPNETVAPAPAEIRAIREAILVELATSGADLARVAKRVAMSTRTVQRRITAELATSYQDLVDSIRASTARALLADRTRSIIDVAFELGYADLKSFYRAFRRWTDTTPAEWRKTHP